MANNIAAESASSATKSFFGGITGTLGVIIGIILALCLCCGSLVFFAALGSDSKSKDDEPTKINSDSSTDTSDNKSNDGTSSEFKVGDTIKMGDITLTVNEYVDNVVSKNEYDKPGSGNRFVAVDVKLENAGNSSEYILTDDFTIQDSNSYVYSHEWSEAKSPELQSGNLGKGSSLRGWVVFEVPSKASGLKLIFKTGFWSTKEVKITLK